MKETLGDTHALAHDRIIWRIMERMEQAPRNPAIRRLASCAVKERKGLTRVRILIQRAGIQLLDRGGHATATAKNPYMPSPRLPWMLDAGLCAAEHLPGLRTPQKTSVVLSVIAFGC